MGALHLHKICVLRRTIVFEASAMKPRSTMGRQIHDESAGCVRSVPELPPSPKAHLPGGSVSSKCNGINSLKNQTMYSSVNNAAESSPVLAQEALPAVPNSPLNRVKNGRNCAGCTAVFFPKTETGRAMRLGLFRIGGLSASGLREQRHAAARATWWFGRV